MLNVVVPNEMQNDPKCLAIRNCQIIQTNWHCIIFIWTDFSAIAQVCTCLRFWMHILLGKINFDNSIWIIELTIFSSRNLGLTILYCSLFLRCASFLLPPPPHYYYLLTQTDTHTHMHMHIHLYIVCSQSFQTVQYASLQAWNEFHSRNTYKYGGTESYIHKTCGKSHIPFPFLPTF